MENNKNGDKRQAVATVDESAEKGLSEQTPVFGIVFNCDKLNLREHPSADSEIVFQVKSGDELMVSMEESTDEWFRVHHAGGASGYCMRDYLALKKE